MNEEIDIYHIILTEQNPIAATKGTYAFLVNGTGTPPPPGDYALIKTQDLADITNPQDDTGIANVISVRMTSTHTKLFPEVITIKGTKYYFNRNIYLISREDEGNEVSVKYLDINAITSDGSLETPPDQT